MRVLGLNLPPNVQQKTVITARLAVLSRALDQRRRAARLALRSASGSAYVSPPIDNGPIATVARLSLSPVVILPPAAIAEKLPPVGSETSRERPDARFR